MQWCQPVWDGIDDHASGAVGAITDDSYIQHADYHGMNMHIVTHWWDQQGTDDNGGKGYGKMEAFSQYSASRWRASNPANWSAHRGYDLQARIGAPVFAIRCGQSTAQGTSHFKVLLDWTALSNGSWHTMQYLHLSNNGRVNGSVLTGQIIGFGGRSGNLGWRDVNTPGHVHVNVGTYPDTNPYTSQLFEQNRDHIDEFNIKIIPTNNHPLLLPCKCQIGDVYTDNGADITCNFDSDYARTCWAAMELKCPAMANHSNGGGDAQQVRVIQAQLKRLGYYGSHEVAVYEGREPSVNNTNMNNTPRIMDNALGGRTNTAIACYKLNSNVRLVENDDGVVETTAIDSSIDQIVRNNERQLAFAEANDTDERITELLLTWLNTEAPLPTNE